MSRARSLIPNVFFLVLLANFGALTLFSASDEAKAQEAPIVPLDKGFSLVDEHGRRIESSAFKGKPTVLFFGFTHCPDICPTSLTDIVGWMKTLGPDADRLNYVFVSVDWMDDTPSTLLEYVSSFDARIRGLSGTQDEIKAATRAFGAFSTRVPTGDGGFTFAHSASTYLLDARGAQVATIEYGEDHASGLDKVRRLAARRESASAQNGEPPQ